MSFSVGSTESALWRECNFATIDAKGANGKMNLMTGDTKGFSQTFTAKESLVVGEISLLLQRLQAGLDFNLDIYELHSEGAGATDAANAVKLRYSDPKRATLIRSFSLRPSVSISSGNAGSKFLAISLEADEQFSIKSGHCYSIHIYTKGNGIPQERVLVWNFNKQNAYLGGRYGTNDGAVTVESRDFGLALSASPIVHDAESDTYVEGSEPEKVANRQRLIVRSLNSTSALRGSYAYIRFDLGQYQHINPGSIFSLTRLNQIEWSKGQLVVYGLLESEGLTSQDWLESQFTYSKAGIELKPLVHGQNPLAESKLFEIGPMQGSASQKTVQFLHPNLDRFLESRAGKMATLIVANNNFFKDNEAIADTSMLGIKHNSSLSTVQGRSVELGFFQIRAPRFKSWNQVEL